MDNCNNNDEHQSTDHIKQSQHSDRHHQAIITAIDTQLDKDKNDFVKRLSNQAEKQEEIERLAHELKGDIKNLSGIVKKILDKHHTDYIMTFSAFMETVRKDLRKKIEQMDQIEEQQKKANDISVFKCERDFFLSYSIKLSSINKELTNKIDEMSLKMKILSDEVNSLTLKWQSLEKENKHLLIELESSLLKNRDLKKDNVNLRYYKDHYPQQNHPVIHIEDSNDISNKPSESYLHQKKSIDIIEKLKSSLKKEKFRNHRSSSEINNIVLEKNKLENIFLDCVEETRKNVWNRRLMGTMTSKMTKNSSSSFPRNSIGEYKTFLPPDKREILESFLFNNDVFPLLRDALLSNKSIDNNSQNQQQKPNRLYFKKINLKKHGSNKEETIEDKMSFFNPKRDSLLNVNTKKGIFGFLKKAQSQNMLLPIKMN